MKRKKQQPAHVVVRNLKKLRKELARRRYDFVARQVVEKIDTCLYEEYEIPTIKGYEVKDENTA